MPARPRITRIRIARRGEAVCLGKEGKEGRMRDNEVIVVDYLAWPVAKPN